jgi:hypothetical protein
MAVPGLGSSVPRPGRDSRAPGPEQFSNPVSHDCYSSHRTSHGAAFYLTRALQNPWALVVENDGKTLLVLPNRLSVDEYGVTKYHRHTRIAAQFHEARPPDLIWRFNNRFLYFTIRIRLLNSRDGSPHCALPSNEITCGINTFQNTFPTTNATSVSFGHRGKLGHENRRFGNYTMVGRYSCLLSSLPQMLSVSSSGPGSALIRLSSHTSFLDNLGCW